MNSLAPTFSVVIPTHNRPDDLRRAVDSALAQTLPPLEVVVVHDGTTPSTSIVDFEGGPNARVVYLETGKLSGASRARNLGIREAKGDYIAFLDDDDTFAADKLSVVATKLVYAGSDVAFHDFVYRLPHEKRSFIARPPATEITPDAMLVRNLIGGPSSVVVKRSALLEVGGFDEELPALEDYELWLRLSLAGKQFVYVDRALAVYNASSKRASRTTRMGDDLAAWSIMERRYATHYQRLPRWQRRAQRTFAHAHRGHRALMRYDRWKAFRYYQAAFWARPSGSSLRYLGASVLTLIHPRFAIAMKGM